MEAIVKSRGAESTMIFGFARIRAAEKSQEAMLEEAYDTYAHPLFRYALALVGSADDAEDAVQEVFLRLAREPGRLRNIESMKAYMFAATRNAAWSLLRKRKRRNELVEELCADFIAGSGYREEELPVEAEVLCRALAGLAVEQREVLVLKVFEGLTFREIAETARAPIATITSRYRYGIEKLRRVLEEDCDG